MMIQCIFFAIYFEMWFVIGEDLPDWIVVLNTIGLALTTIASIVLWECHKDRIEKLEEEIKQLKESQNETR